MEHKIPLITNIQRYSLNDGPGIRTTIFLKGCPLHCWWCHNPETQSHKPDIYFRPDRCTRCGMCKQVCPIDAINLDSEEERIKRNVCSLCLECVRHCPNKALERIGDEYVEEKFLKEVLSDVVFYNNSGGGVTISGGEPLAFPEFVLELLKKIKAQNIFTCVDTTGYAEWSAIEPLIPYLDIALFDVKCIDKELHKKYTGVSNEIILQNFTKLAKSPVKVRTRIPIIPEFNYDLREIEKIADFVEGQDIDGVDILPYHRFSQAKYRLLNMPYRCDKEKDLTKDDVKEYAEIFIKRNIPTTIGG